MGLHQTNELLHGGKKLSTKQKGSLLNGRRYLQNNVLDKGLISKTHKALRQLRIRKTNHQIKKRSADGLPGSPVVKILPSNTESTGLIPGQGGDLTHLVAKKK